MGQGLHFLDSGAFSLQGKASAFAKEHKVPVHHYFDSREYRQYLDDYATFVKKYHYAIDYYANVDVIPDPKRTWANQQYLEQTHGLKPVPVVHCFTELKWLEKYLNLGYEFIGFGGLVGKEEKESRPWLDECFDLICNTADRLPHVRIHGFGVTSISLMSRYPWWSVDSATWTKVGAFGSILVPPLRGAKQTFVNGRLVPEGGRFAFDQTPWVITTSREAPSIKIPNSKHYQALSEFQQRSVRRWLKEIGVPFGKTKKGEIVEYGVTNRHVERKIANLYYFERLRATLPAWPWPFRRKEAGRRRGMKELGLLA